MSVKGRLEVLSGSRIGDTEDFRAGLLSEDEVECLQEDLLTQRI